MEKYKKFETNNMMISIGMSEGYCAVLLLKAHHHIKSDIKSRCIHIYIYKHMYVYYIYTHIYMYVYNMWVYNIWI